MSTKNLVVGTLTGLALALTACGGGGNGPAPEASDGQAKVSVSGLSASQITSLVITAEPGNISKTLAYDAAHGVFTGKLVLPAGTYTLTAAGYTANPQDGVVASGSGSVTVTPNITTAVTLRIYDQTAPAGQQDIAPIIRTVGASKADLVVNEPITVTVDAVDLDGDAMAYQWTSDCPESSFADPSAASTTWVSPKAASCTLQVQVVSNQISLSESVAVLVYSSPDNNPEGGAQINGEYVARPYVSALYLSGPDIGYHSLGRGYGGWANFPAVHAGMQYTVEAGVSFDTRYGTFEAEVRDSCGGALEKRYDSCAGGNGSFCYVTYTWTAPAAGSACKLSGFANNSGLTDSFSAGVLVR